MNNLQDPFIYLKDIPESTIEDIKTIFGHFFKEDEVYMYACILFYRHEFVNNGNDHTKAQESLKKLADNIRQIIDSNKIYEDRRKAKENDTNGN